jgi:hypothetical protein
MASNNEQFYKRLRKMSGIVPVTESKKETNTKTLVGFERANNGTAYGIVKENHHYFIKKALVSEGEVGVTDFAYIDGVENKGKYQYNSLGEAEKQRNFYLRGINEAWDQGGVYFVNESKETESPSLDADEDFSSLVKRTITEGKKNITESREKKFKSTLPENNKKGAGARIGLMPEAADLAVKKALGIVNEEKEGAPFEDNITHKGATVTADSEIKDSDIVADKKGKEAPQAPINDSNAQKIANKATGKSKKDANKYPDASNSIAVNQADKVLKEEVSPLVTADSEENADDSVANDVNQKHEPSQAPINDTNAKAEADKATGSGSASAAIQNNVDEQPESDPFDDKENAGDEKGDIVTEDADKGQPFDDKAKLNTSGDIVAADSDEKDADRVDDETKHENPDADYNNYNQPEKGQKEEKGEALKPVASKKDIVAEADALITADSEIAAADALANMTTTNLPDAIAEGDVEDAMADKKAKGVAWNDIKNDNEMHGVMTPTSVTPSDVSEGKNEPFDKETKAGDEKGDIVAEEDAKEQPESEPFDDKENAGDEKGDIVAEGESLITKDSKIKPADSIAHQDKGGNISYSEPKLVQGTSKAMNDNAIAEAEGEEDIDAAASALDSLDIATDAEEAAPEMSGAEEPIDTEMGAELGAELGDEVPDAEAEEGNSENLAVQEIEKLVGKVTEKIRTTDLEPETAEGFLKSVVTSFKDKLPDIDLDAREEVAKDIKEPDQMGGHVDGVAPEGGEEMDVGMDAEVAPEMGGEPEMDAEVAPEMGAEPAMDAIEEPAMEEDAPMQVNGEDFEQYMESRGYSKDNLEECSSDEMGSIVSGYLTDKDGEMDEAEVKNIASYMDDNVATELEEYGHGDFADKARPFMSEDGISFGMTEPTMSPIEMGEEGEEESPEEVADEIEDAIEDVEGVESVEMEVGDEEVPVVDDEPVVPIGEPADDAPVMGFATDSEVMGAGMPRPDNGLAPKTKSVEVDVNAGTVKLEVSESDKKVRNYVKNRLEELAGKRKPTINESAKSDNLKKLDKLIEQQWQLMGDSVKKKS